ncbi:MAG: hypothetical protein ACI857_001839, partial [Arenicella sp.]
SFAGLIVFRFLILRQVIFRNWRLEKGNSAR